MAAAPSDMSNMPKMKQLDRVSLPKDIAEQTEDLLVVRRETLDKLGIDKATIDKLLDAKVIAQHGFLTCGDYNL